MTVTQRTGSDYSSLPSQFRQSKKHQMAEKREKPGVPSHGEKRLAHKGGQELRS
jgi:hypothetical protein